MVLWKLLWITVAFFTPSEAGVKIFAPQSRRAARHIRGGSHFKKHIPQFLPKRLCTFVRTPALVFIKKVSSFQSFILSNCPVLTVVFYGLFLKNKTQGILTGLIKLYTIKSSRKISTLILGQRPSWRFFWIALKRGAPTHAPTPRAFDKVFAPFNFVSIKIKSINNERAGASARGKPRQPL